MVKRTIFFCAILSLGLRFYPFEADSESMCLKGKKTNVPILIVSIPKCGTHLLCKLLEHFGLEHKSLHFDSFLRINFDSLQELKADQFSQLHIIASQANIAAVLKAGCKVIFISRDPRDQIVSLAHYMKSAGSSTWIAAFLPLDRLISQLIVDYGLLYYTKKKWPWNDVRLINIGSVKQFYDLYAGWYDYPSIYTTTFESLIGSKGGGNDDLQHQEIMAIAEHCGLRLSDAEIAKIQEALFGGTTTFRAGRIGAWKEHFMEDDKIAFKRVAGELLIELQYEKDLNW